MSVEIIGASLFQTTHIVNRSTIDVSSTRNSVVLIALYDEGHRGRGCVDSLQSNGWTLKEGWFVEYSNRYQLNTIFYKEIDAGTKVQFTCTQRDKTFAIFVYDGK